MNVNVPGVSKMTRKLEKSIKTELAAIEIHLLLQYSLNNS